MNTRAKIIVDRLLAKPLAFTFNLFVRIAGHLLRRNHSVADADVRHIVVTKLLGMGSIVQATPLLRALRRRFPSARIAFLSGASNRGLLQRLPMVDEVMVLRDQSMLTLVLDVVRVLWTLIRRRVDLFFDLEVYSAGTSVLSALSMARNRYGFYRHSARFKKGLHTHLVYMNVDAPIAQLYLQLFRAIGGDCTVPDGEDELFGPVRVDDAERVSMRDKIAGLGVPRDQPYFVVNPNASDLLVERRWPREHFVAVMEKLVRDGRTVVLTGSPSEREFVESVRGLAAADARQGIINSAGALTLAELFALVEGAACVITNDTGPMHLAIAFNRPMVCMFGPGAPNHYGVYRKNIAVLYRGVICSPCIYEVDEPPCAGNNICMQRIAPDEVLVAVDQVLRDASQEHPHPAHVRDAYVDARGEALGVVARSSFHPRV